jgi:hypothetical protein
LFFSGSLAGSVLAAFVAFTVAAAAFSCAASDNFVDHVKTCETDEVVDNRYDERPGAEECLNEIVAGCAYESPIECANRHEDKRDVIESFHREKISE